MTEEGLIPLGDATPRDTSIQEKAKRKQKKKGKACESGKENSDDNNTDNDSHAELAPLKLTKSGRRWDSVGSPGKSPGKLDFKGGLMKGCTLSAQSKALLDKLPQVDKRRGFEMEAKLFQQVQKEYEQALAKKRTVFDIASRAKHNAVIPLLSRKDVGDTTPKLGLAKKMVLPAIPGDSTEQQCCSSQAASGEILQVRTVEEVYSMLPEEFNELKQMMDLHRDLKAQMARNKEQMSRLQQSGEDAEMMDLLRQQSSHVVMMMKDVLDRMETYPEELWALYGAVEAYEKCTQNMEALKNGKSWTDTNEEVMGPQTLDEHREALVDIYGHVLEGVQRFLAVGAEKRAG